MQMPSEGHKHHIAIAQPWHGVLPPDVRKLEEHTQSNDKRSMLPSPMPPCKASSKLWCTIQISNCDTTGERWKVEETARQGHFLCVPFLVLFSGEWGRGEKDQSFIQCVLKVCTKGILYLNSCGQTKVWAGLRSNTWKYRTEKY